MKKYILITAFFLFTNKTMACDICGCGVGNYYIGLLPQFSKSFVGLRYQFSSFHTIITGNTSQYSKELFNTIEVWGGFNIGKRWQVITIVPINIIHQINDDGILKNSGLGDIAVMSNYKLYNHVSATAGKKLIAQTIWISAGVKAPTGKFNIAVNEPNLAALANTEVGSGSTDFILNANYIVSINRWGLTTNLQYKINNTNRYNYYFGNKLSAGSTAYYTIITPKFTITPNAGLLYTHNQINKFNQLKIADSDGYFLSSAIGSAFNYKKITVGCSLQIPLSQRFANGQTITKTKAMFHISFSL